MAQGKRNEPTAIPSPAERAYAAGFIDGEGCISIGVQKNSWVAKLTVVQVDPRPLHLLAQFWGGAVSKKKPGPRRALAYEWRIVGKQFYRCMDDILSMGGACPLQSRSPRRRRAFLAAFCFTMSMVTNLGLRFRQESNPRLRC
jgi:hypothetical protein